MIKIAGAAVLVLGFAAVAQAGGGGAHFTASSNTLTQGGGAGIGGGAAGGSGTVLHVPPTRFATREVSGNSSDYIPSTFVSYNSAVAEGSAPVAARPKPLEMSAQKSGKPTVRSATIQIVQKQDGRLAIQH